MHNNIGEGPGAGQPDRMQLVEELQLARRSSPQNVRNVVATAIAIEIRPADSMQRQQLIVSGQSTEIQALSMSAELAGPVAIGGFYEIQFDEQLIALEPTFARCDQITMLAEDRFATRFQFLSPIVSLLAGSPDPDSSGRSQS